MIGIVVALQVIQILLTTIYPIKQVSHNKSLIHSMQGAIQLSHFKLDPSAYVYGWQF